MEILEGMIHTELKKILSFPRIGTKLVARRLERLGITLNDSQLADIRMQLECMRSDKGTMELCGFEKHSSERGSEGIEYLLHIDLSDRDQDIQEITDCVAENVRKAIPKISIEVSAVISTALKDQLYSILQQRKRQRDQFELNLNKVWARPIDLLEMLLAISLEAGEGLNNQFRSKASRNEDLVFDVLTRLHARACKISSEIVTLLRSGHADGAHARWRSLHEIAVVGFFIESYGNDVAERYLLHEGVESYKATKLYQDYCARLQYEPLTNEEVRIARERYEHLLNRFGRSYTGDYGWASTALGKKNPTFRDIERNVLLDHMRPYYKLASHNIHANPKGILFKLGLAKDSGEVLLAGPSNMGLADPGHGCAITLTQITIALLLTRPNIDRLVMCRVLLQLADEIGKEFIQAHESLSQDTNGLA
jgi:hypothetical protein